MRYIEDKAELRLTTYTLGPEGLRPGDEINIPFLKGSKDNVVQEGIIPTDLLQGALEYLQSVNVGEMRTKETSMAITKIEEALMWLDKRRRDRKSRNVLNTYKK